MVDFFFNFVEHSDLQTVSVVSFQLIKSSSFFFLKTYFKLLVDYLSKFALKSSVESEHEHVVILWILSFEWDLRIQIISNFWHKKEFMVKCLSAQFSPASSKIIKLFFTRFLLKTFNILLKNIFEKGQSNDISNYVTIVV